MHKSDLGGVALNLVDAAALRTAWTAMAARLPLDRHGATVSPMALPGVETVVGIAADPLFGPLVVFGLGGVFSDLLDDRALRLVPLTDLDAADLIRGVRAAPLLVGYRGAPAVDVAAVEDLLLRVGRLAEDLPRGRRARPQPGHRPCRRGAGRRCQGAARPATAAPRPAAAPAAVRSHP